MTQCFVFLISPMSPDPGVREGETPGAALWIVRLTVVGTLWSCLPSALVLSSFPTHLNFPDLGHHVLFPSPPPFNLVLSFPTNSFLSLPKLDEV